MDARGSLLTIAILASACAADATSTVSHQIVGGAPSEPSAFPATGMLVVREGLMCTATLIAPDVALTAAHCLRPPRFGGFGFTLDVDDSDGAADVIPVLLTHQHPDFDDSVDKFVDLGVRNDIGIAILARPVQGVVPAQIDQASASPAVDAGMQLALCGYGRVQWDINEPAIKRDAAVIVDRAQDREFSTTADDPQPCNGDSGGPLFADGPTGQRLVGVVSRAMGRSVMCDTGAIITRVAPYAKWIERESQDRDLGGCNARGDGSILPVLSLWAVARLSSALARRRRRRPR
jgi:protease YdgD